MTFGLPEPVILLRGKFFARPMALSPVLLGECSGERVMFGLIAIADDAETVFDAIDRYVRIECDGVVIQP